MRSMLILLLLFCACSLTGNVITIVAPAEPIQNGSSVELALKITNVTDLAGVQVELQYDSLLEYVSSQEGTFLSESGEASTLFSLDSSIPGFLSLTMLRLDGEGVSGDGTIATFEFIAHAGTTNISFSELLLANSSAAQLQLSHENFTLTISEAAPTNSSSASGAESSGGGGGGGSGSVDTSQNFKTTSDQSNNSESESYPKYSNNTQTSIKLEQQNNPNSTTNQTPTPITSQQPITFSTAKFFRWLYILLAAIIILIIIGMVVHNKVPVKSHTNHDVTANVDPQVQTTPITNTPSTSKSLTPYEQAILAGAQYVIHAQKNGKNQQQIIQEFESRSWSKQQITAVFEMLKQL